MITSTSTTVDTSPAIVNTAATPTLSRQRKNAVTTFNGLGKEKVIQGDKFKLKYIRLRALNYEATIEFYQALGMNLEWEVERLVPGTHITGAYFQFKTTDPDFNKRSLGLFFEYDQSPHAVARAQSAWRLPEGDYRWSQDYVLVYVRSLGRLFKRLQSNSNIKIKIPPAKAHDIQYLVLEDPNGLEVRLVECTDQQLVEGDNRILQDQWFARLGYYAREVDSTDEIVPFYERLLSEPAVSAANGYVSSSNGSTARSNLVALSMGNRTKNIYTNVTSRTGFRVVDSEDIVNGLNHGYFWWMGNDLRERAGCVNFVEKFYPPHKSTASTKLLPSPLLISFGFELNPFYPTMDSLNKIWGNTVTYAEWCTPLNDVGIISRVLDPSNVTFLEIFTTPNGKPTSLKNRTRQKRTTMDVPATAMKTKNEQDVGSERTSVKADAGKSENRQHGARSKSWNHMLLQYHDSKVRDVVSMRQSVMALRKVKSLNALDIFGVVADDFKKRTRAKDDVLIITEEKDRKHDKNSRSLINIAEERE